MDLTFELTGFAPAKHTLRHKALAKLDICYGARNAGKIRLGALLGTRLNSPNDLPVYLPTRHFNLSNRIIRIVTHRHMPRK